jgi:WSC domain
LKQSNGFRYAGLLYYGNCLCGTMLPPPAPEADCNFLCNGDPTQTCGANQRISIWKDPTYPAVDLSTIVSDYVSLGCYTEGTGYRAVTYRQDQLSSSSLTTQACLSACGNEYYPLAATEFAGECYCGYILQGGSVPAPSTDCNMACTGDATEICGGPSRLNLYEAKILESTKPCGSNPPPPPSTCSGTAYGYATAGGLDQTFVSLGIGKNWGWVISGSPPISGTLYLGAGGNDISKATAVGTFTIAHVGSKLVVTYNTNAPWYVSSTHFYYGTTYPSKIAPGQFGNKHDGFPASTTTDQYSITFDPTKSTYIIHAGIAYTC